LRIEFEGALYHVLSRGNERRPIFQDNKDCFLFLELMGEMSERFEGEICAYALMDNHYHLLLKTKRANLSKYMQWFGTSYTRRYNLEHKRSGHLFQGRFKSFLIENDKYLTRLSCYIHRNPLRAGIVKRLVDYPWSSYKIYAYGKKTPKWVKTNTIFCFFEVEEKHRAYREMVQCYSQEEEKIWEDFCHGLFLGSQKFVDSVKSKYITGTPAAEIPQKRKILRPANPENILKRATSILKCDINDLLGSSRISGKKKEQRDLLVFFASSVKSVGQFRFWQIPKYMI